MSFTITREMIHAHETAEALGLGAVNSARERMLRNMEQADRVLRQIEEVERIRKTMDVVTTAERAMRQIDEARAGIWRHISRFQHRALENLERIRREMEIIDRVRRQVQIVRTAGHALRRNQDGASGKGRKSSTKKSTKSASGGGNGGDGGGDGDGPAHKRKKYPPKKIPSTCPTHPPHVPTGEIAPQQLPPPQSPAQHRISPLAYLCMLGLIGLAFTTDNVFIRSLVIIVSAPVVLCVIGHPDVAKQFLTSKTIPALIARLASLFEGKK